MKTRTANQDNKQPRRNGRFRRRRVTRTVYIQLREWDRATFRAKSCTGLHIKAFDFTAQEVHQIILDALRAAAEKHQAVARAQKVIDDASHNRKL